MKFKIVKDLPSRLRLETPTSFTDEFGFGLEAAILKCKHVDAVCSNARNRRIRIDYQTGYREAVLSFLRAMTGTAIAPMHDELRLKAIELKRTFEAKLFHMLRQRYILRPFMPGPVRAAMTIYRAIPFLHAGFLSLMRGRLNVKVLDAAAIGISLIQSKLTTGGSTIFLLRMSELLEEWTTSRSRLDLSKSLEINVDKVLVERDGDQRWVPIGNLLIDDIVIVSQGSIIPADGVVVDGLATVDESKMTGESEPANKQAGSYVFASTVLQEGVIRFRVERRLEHSRIYEIIEAIENSDEAKSRMASQAVAVADRIVPFSFLGAGLVYLMTRSLTKMTSVLMVDYSCALKLATPLAVIAGLRQAAKHNVLVKGGRYLEEAANADVFVFDKTGTLTTSMPTVKNIHAFEPFDRTEFLRLAACIEEHFPHSMGRAIVKQAEIEGITHAEKHAEVEYIVAHGISTRVDEHRVLIGSRHYIFEDNDTEITPQQHEALRADESRYSIIYMSVDGKLAGYVSLEDPLKPEAGEIIRRLKETGVREVHMLTGDGERAAKNIAEQLALNHYVYEVLPIEKRDYLQALKDEDKRICMVGDGINDSPALSLADVSVSLKDSSDLAKDVADIVIQQDSLEKLLIIRQIGHRMARRINRNYACIVGINTGLILMGVTGMLSPTMTAAIHNLSTLAIGSYSTMPYRL